MRENSRRAKALSELAKAEDSIAKSIMHLGGYTRVTVPKKNISTFVARKMLEGISLRLHAMINLLNYGERPKAEKQTEALP